MLGIGQRMIWWVISRRIRTSRWKASHKWKIGLLFQGRWRLFVTSRLSCCTNVNIPIHTVESGWTGWFGDLEINRYRIGWLPWFALLSLPRNYKCSQSWEMFTVSLIQDRCLLCNFISNGWKCVSKIWSNYENHSSRWTLTTLKDSTNKHCHSQITMEEMASTSVWLNSATVILIWRVFCTLWSEQTNTLQKSHLILPSW